MRLFSSSLAFASKETCNETMLTVCSCIDAEPSGQVIRYCRGRNVRCFIVKQDCSVRIIVSGHDVPLLSRGLGVCVRGPTMLDTIAYAQGIL